MTTYTWWLNDSLDGALHMDYRNLRGLGVGPDLNLRLGRWGNGEFKYYYLHDQRPGTSLSTNKFPNLSGAIPENRQRIYFGWQATPATNLNVKALVNYQSDPLLLHDFYEGDYAANLQPNTFVEANKYSEQLEPRRADDAGGEQFLRPGPAAAGREAHRLAAAGARHAGLLRERKLRRLLPPELRRTQLAVRRHERAELQLRRVARRHVPATAAAGNIFRLAQRHAARRRAVDLLQRGNRAGRHQRGNLPESFQHRRGLFVQVLAALDRRDEFAAGHGRAAAHRRAVGELCVRAAPSTLPPQLPQFDSAFPSLLLLPIQLPDYNDIDSIDSENVIRFGLRNTLQTRRAGELQNLLDWNVLLDWRLHPKTGQGTFNDLYSDLTFRPRSWLTLESQTRYDINSGHFNLAYHQITFTPNERWSWGLGHIYTRGGFVDSGDNLISSTMFFRVNDNWGFRTSTISTPWTGCCRTNFTPSIATCGAGLARSPSA